jgi:hypothetical protein
VTVALADVLYNVDSSAFMPGHGGYKTADVARLIWAALLAEPEDETS